MTHPPLADNRDRARQTAAGTWQPWADPAPVRDHVTGLLQASTFQAVGRAAQVGEMTVWEIAHGARPAIKHQTAAALLAIQPSDLHPQRAAANGGMWRLRSLVAMGHTTGRLAAALGAPRHVIEPLIRGERATITTALGEDIHRLFDAWWDKRPPRRTPAQKAAACNALQRAAVHNWPCPAALDEDELDLPGYQPTARWRYARGTGIAAEDPLGKNHLKEPAPGPVAAVAKPARQTRTAAGYPSRNPRRADQGPPQPTLGGTNAGQRTSHLPHPRRR
jgi:hypothetical protein